MRECLNEHGESCHHDPQACLPTRILDVGSPTEDAFTSSIRIVQLQKPGVWVALSHCWGSGNHFTTTSTNLDARLKCIEFRELPRTFQDAVIVTRRLGFQYLWIDSLCILQDSHQDWAREAARMHLYYRNATLMIAVDSAAGDSEGYLYQRRSNDLPLAAFPIARSGPNNLAGDISDSQTQTEHVFVRKRFIPAEEPLNKRAWTVQENILSPRTIHYTSQGLKWECPKRLIPEQDLNPSYVSELHKKKDFLSPLRPPPKGKAADEIGPQIDLRELFDSWYNILNDYVRRDITNPSDRLTALSGIAHELQNRTLGTYIAGLWLKDIYYGLLWTYHGRGRKPTTYRAPS